LKTDDGNIKGKISFYCRVLDVSRQAFYDYLEGKNKPWKYKSLADEMMKIHNEDKYNDCYGRKRMYMALLQKKEAGEIDIDIPSESTVRKVMEQIGLIHKPRRKPNSITKADREAHKSDDLLKRDFKAEKPLEKAVTDISELKGSDGKVYVSAIFDCFDLMPLGLAIEDNMKASLCRHTLENAKKAYPDIKGCIIHSDRGSQYTSTEYRAAVKRYGIVQSMNSEGGKCHDNARCESMWARMKEELFYSRNDKPERYTRAELKEMIWRYFMSYWKNRRICSANGGLPPAVKRKRYYEEQAIAA
jgi:transposase InsO family protein